MNLPRFAVQRPVFTTMIALIVVVLGLASLLRLRIDLLPAVEVPRLTITTGYEGADPEVVERRVTQIVEEIINTVPGVTELTSESSEGRSQIRATFSWGTDLDTAALDVRARLEEELNELPDEVDRPQIRKFDVASFPVVLLGVASDSLDPLDLTDLVERQIRYRFARLAGVAQVDLWGGFDRELRVAIDPDRARALGIGPLDVVQVIRASNVDLPAGSIDEGRFEVVLRAPAELASITDVENLVVTVRDGAAITVGQIATVQDTHEKLGRLIRVGGEQGIRVAIRKEADANTVEVSRAILEEIAAVNADMPQITVTPVINQGNFIERSIANVAQSVLYGGALAILVLLFFLRNLRSTVVIGLAIPLSIMATLALVYGGGLTLNLMTLGGLALGVGMMVDNAIVVLENIFRRRSEEQESPHQAAERGAGEVAGAIIASTITTLVIFLPLVVVEGVAGLLFQELALVVVYALLASLVVALTLVPMLAARVLKTVRDPTVTATGSGLVNRLTAAADRGFAALDRAYRDLLHLVLRQRLVTVAGSVGLVAASLLLWPHIGSEFMPPSDEGEVRVSGEFAPGTRLDIADRHARRMEAIVTDAVPELQSAVTSVSASGRRGDAAAEADMRLNVGPSSGRQRSNEAIAADLRQRLEGQVPGMSVRVRAPQGQFLLERLLGGNEGIEIRIRGYDLGRLAAYAEQVKAVVAAVPGITDVDDDIEDGIPQEHLQIDRAKVADLGLTVRAVGEALEAAVGGVSAGDFRPEGYSFPIRVQLADAELLPLGRILDQTITTPTGEAVALGNLVITRPGKGPAQISRTDQERTVTVTAEVAGRDEGSVAAEISEALRGIPFPVGYEARVGGSYEEQQKAFLELAVGFALAIELVYMVLACQYESLRDPLVVMGAVPLAAIGVLVALYITRSTMNVQSGIGCIMLGGIVVNNAILLVDQARRLRAEGLAVAEAVAEAGRRRLRPILMTTATTVLGLLPLALGIGEGADAQAPLARAVVGGLVASTLISLLLIPALYSLAHPERKPEAAA